MIKAIETIYNGYRFRSRLEARWAVFFDTLGISYRYEEDGYPLEGVWYLPDFKLSGPDCYIEIKGQEPTDEEREKADLLSIYKEKPVYIFYGDIWVPDHEKTKSAYFAGEDFRLIGVSASKFDYERRQRRAEQLELTDEEDIADHYETQTDCYLPNTPSHLLALFYKLRKYHTNLMVISRFKGLTRERSQHLRVIAPLDISQQVLAQIKVYEQELISLLAYHENWTWELEGTYASSQYYWCECPFCGKYGITYLGKTDGLPCGCFERREVKGHHNYNTPRLIKAYTAARQARFEHGESGRR